MISMVSGLLYVGAVLPVAGFIIPSSLRARHGRTWRGESMVMSSAPRSGIQLPLLDVTTPEEYGNRIVVPLPSSHLPDEMSTPFLYGMELDRPVYKLLMEKAIEGGSERTYGHVAYKPDPDTLVGAIGCAAQILIHAPQEDSPDEDASARGKGVGDPSDDSSPMTVVCRGSFRFVVREVLKTFPYPLAIVDELVDEEPTPTTERAEVVADEEDDDEDDDEDYDDYYDDLEPSELVQQAIMGLRTCVKQQLDSTSNLSPLERSILKDSGFTDNADYTEEMAAVLDVFVSSLIDICPMPVERYYAIGMMAAEIANVSNEIRRDVLKTTDGVARLRLVLQQVQERVGMASARKITNDITIPDEEQQLQVGTPQLPPWAKQMTKGTRIEYFWNEEYGWCSGVVVEQPLLILDELVVTVTFDDGETHKLPFRGDEKVRWRPAQQQ